MAQSQRQRPDLDYQIGRQALPSRNLQTHKGVSSPHTHRSEPTTPTSRHFYSNYEPHNHNFENEKKSIIKRAKEKAKRWRYSILRRKSNNKPQEIDENHGATNYGLPRGEDSSSTIHYLNSNSNPTRITSQANGNWEIEMKQANDVGKQPSIAYNPPKDTTPMAFPSTTNMNQASEYTANHSSLLHETSTKKKTVNQETTTSTSIGNGDDANCETKSLDPITNDHGTVNEIVQEKLSPFSTFISPISTSIVSGHKIRSEKEMQSPVAIASAPATYGYETIDEPLIDTSTSISSDHKNIEDVETLSPSPMSFGFVNGHKTIDGVETLSQSLFSFGSIVNGHKTIGETLAPAYTMALEATLLIASKILESWSQAWNRGVSMKEYLMNKLEPKEEDRALCDVITEAVSLRIDFNRSIAETGQVDTSKKGIDTSSIAKGVVSSSVKEERHDFNSPLPISTNPYIEDFEIRGRTH